MMGKRFPRESFRGHERDRQQHGESTEDREGRHNLTYRETTGGHGGVVIHPEQRPGIQLLDAHEERDEDAPECGLPPEYPVLAHHEEQSDAAESENVQAESGYPGC